MAEWISVKDKLPRGGDIKGELCENVCLLLDDGTVTCGWMNGLLGKVFYLDDIYDYICEAPITNVTHWMPLPQKPTVIGAEVKDERRLKMKYTDSIVADAVRKAWNSIGPQDMVAFFWQKYEFEDAWEWCEELVECESSADYDTVIFLNDFCEGQTCIKNLVIVPLRGVTGFYAAQHMLKEKSIDDIKNFTPKDACIKIIPKEANKDET